MFPLVGYLLVFSVIAIVFLGLSLLVGKLLRPRQPHEEKADTYECGEETIGSAWVQFDLRYYVVALLFVIFDVEVAFFFPWAVVFGQANRLDNPAVPVQQRAEAYLGLTPNRPEALTLSPLSEEFKEQQRRVRVEQLLARSSDPEAMIALREEMEQIRPAARKVAWVSFLDVLVFFGVLLVGFAYLWKRGDLAWVRTVEPPTSRPAALVPLRVLGVSDQQHVISSTEQTPP